MLHPLILAGLLAAAPPTPFELRDGDRVVLLGSALIEYEQFHGYLETELLVRSPGRKLTFRNLGWSGDTVRGNARTSGYQNPEGLARLLREVKELKPTVLFLGYGMNESFAGPAGLADFVKGYHRLLDELAPLKARIVILSPTPHEDLGRPLPDPANHNRHLAQYTAALKDLAKERGIQFVNLFRALDTLPHRRAPDPLTTNGILLNSDGYHFVAEAILGQLHVNKPGGRRLELDATGKVIAVDGRRPTGDKTGPGLIRFRIPNARGAYTAPRWTLPLTLRIAGLAEGKYALKVDGREYFSATAAEWDRGISTETDLLNSDFDKLRAAVVKCNELFYRRWRPFNDHSRHWGFMAKDFQLYDDEVAAQERVIEQLRQGTPHTFEVVRENDN